MNYIVDNDLHIHSYLSPCSGDREQTPEMMLEYAKKNGFSDICITDHFWDLKIPGYTTFLEQLNLDLLKKALPLPQSDGIRFMFGCETELDRFGHLAIHPDTYDEFDFIIVPINHFHLDGFTISEEDYENVPRIAELWVERFNYVLDQPLPFEKVGFAHLTCELMAMKTRHSHLDVVNAIDKAEMRKVFRRAADKGAGIELNFETFFDYTEKELEELMLPYRIAKEEGCKFYFGSDAHHPDEMARSKEKFSRVVDLLDLTENDKFRVAGRCDDV